MTNPVPCLGHRRFTTERGTMNTQALRDIALLYHEAGLPPLDLPAGRKSPPPDGRTGYTGTDMTRAEVELALWLGNIGIRMPPDVLGIDVDVYHGGDATLRDLVKRCGKLPNTFISHSGRNDGSGIYYFRVPAGMSWIASLPGIEVIQRTHRYAAVWPSMHPDGRMYGWWDQAEGGPMEGVPTVDDLPELPWAWVAELSRANTTDVDGMTRSTAATADGLRLFVDGHTQADAPDYIVTIVAYFVEHYQRGYSRHDSMQHCLTWALECAAANVASAMPTIMALADVWVVAVGDDPRRAELWSTRRVTEFEAMVRHAVGKANAKTQAELFKIHDDIAGIPFNVPPPPAADLHQQPPPAAPPPTVIMFKAAPNPFVLPVITWHAVDLLCQNTHGELAGAEKTLKSYTGLCLDVALAAGLPVLGRWEVAERQRVLLLIGEGGEGPFLRRLAEVCYGYGITVPDLDGWLRYTTDHASANTPRFLDGIRNELETFGPSLVHADPWYTYQPSGTDSGQLASIGVALDTVGQLCREGGSTFLLNHHFNRQGNAGLRQITGAGHAEWVDSWMLTSHRSPPNLEAGQYRLRLDVGSRQWGGGSYDVDYTITPELGRMGWQVSVASQNTEAEGDALAGPKVLLLRIGNLARKAQSRAAWLTRTVEYTKDERNKTKGYAAAKLRAAFDELVIEGQLIVVATVKAGNNTVSTYEVAPDLARG